jgi:hypothetical protein
MLSLAGEWFPALDTQANDTRLWWKDTGSTKLQPGMFGSPIVNDKGVAVGVVTNIGNDGEGYQGAIHLIELLPGWLMRSILSG